jgi:flagellar hook-associated protein FlgK
MTAIPPRLEDALRFNGFTIEQADVAEVTISTVNGPIVVPAMRQSKLMWQRGTTPAETPADSFYLQAIPVFDTAYRPSLLSQILDRFSTRRIGYDTPDQFGLAVRRWCNLELGPQSVLTRRYLSTAVALPLTTQDATTTEKARDASSDFPQGQLAGDLDYASGATDRAGTTQYTGRLATSVMTLLQEQRAAFLNVDAELLDAFESLFLGVFDRDEYDGNAPPLSATHFLPRRW